MNKFDINLSEIAETDLQEYQTYLSEQVAAINEHHNYLSEQARLINIILHLERRIKDLEQMRAGILAGILK